ncbi:hypothetical protein KR059_011214, partial [Drosophila kikkawai]
MFRLMSGIFANSLHGREFCFERLSACRCRSPRKSPPRDYVKKPLAVDLGKSSTQKSRLLELMTQGCPCPKNTAKERWFFTNQHIILGLAKVLERPPNAVSDFLYLLTLQNFSQIMKPVVPPGNHCKVPLVFPNSCEDYMRLFDTQGNIRSRFSHDSLMLLMRVMQAWLRKGAHSNIKPFDPCFEGTQCRQRNGMKTRKAGIDRDSMAHRNGRRRLQESDARACLVRSKLIGYSANGCDYSVAQGSSLQGKLSSGDPGYVFGTHFSPRDSNGWHQDDPPSHLRKLDGPEDELAAERARRLEALLVQLNERTYLTRDAGALIRAIKDIKVGIPARIKVKSAIDNSVKLISDSYYKMLRESATKSRLKNALVQGKDSSQERHKKPSPKHEPEDKSDGPSDPTNKVYYGAQIPVLMHEPYSQDKPWTYMRRHPHQMRMDYKGSIVEGKNIRRYRRSTIAGQMEQARALGAIYSTYSLEKDINASATDVPMFGRRSVVR